MEVLEVVSVDVGRGDVCAASKPPLAGDAVPFLCLKIPSGNHAINISGGPYAVWCMAMDTNSWLRLVFHSSVAKTSLGDHTIVQEA